MKRFSVRVFFFLQAAAIACAGPAVLYGEDYSLAAYLARVEQGNPDLALALKDLEAAQTGVSQARAAFLPSVGLQGGYTRNFTEDIRATPVASLPGGGPLIYQDLRTNYDNELTLGIGVSQTLFDAGAIANYRRARQGQRIREQSLEGAKAEAVCAAKKLYAQAQLALMVVEIMESSERLSLEIYRSAERTYRAGAAAELDMLMAEVNWKTKSVSAAGARKNAALVLIAFRNLGGIPLAEPVALTEPFGELPGAQTLPDAPALDTALAGRADYRALVLTAGVRS
jgi:outer membrane protein TolC